MSLAKERSAWLKTHPNFTSGHVTLPQPIESGMLAQPVGTLFIVTSNPRDHIATDYVCCTQKSLQENLRMMVGLGDVGLEVFVRRHNSIGLHSFVFEE